MFRKDRPECWAVFILSTLADNNYQNKKTIFDMAVGIDAVTATTDGNNDNGGGGTGGGASLVSAVSGVLGTVAREARIPELNGVTPDFFSESGEVLGETAEDANCPPVPWCIFFFILVTYLFLINLNLWFGTLLFKQCALRKEPPQARQVTSSGSFLCPEKIYLKHFLLKYSAIRSVLYERVIPANLI